MGSYWNHYRLAKNGKIGERPNRIILGPYHCIDLVTRYGKPELGFTGGIVYHRAPESPTGWCGGMITWAGEDGDETWTRESEDPLTVSPSVKCSICPQDNGITHGHITNGKWVPAGEMPRWAQ